MIVRIFIKAGDGGDGVVRFRRENIFPLVGQLVVTAEMVAVSTLVESKQIYAIDFKYRRKFVAEVEGRSILKEKRQDGEDLIIKVPPGTIVKDSETGEVLIDLTHENQRYDR